MGIEKSFTLRGDGNFKKIEKHRSIIYVLLPNMFAKLKINNLIQIQIFLHNLL